MKAAVRRPRESRSCKTCRLRRVRCDKAHPACSRCVASQHECVYPDRLVRSRSWSDRNDEGVSPSVPGPSQSAEDVPERTSESPPELGHLDICQSGFSYYASSTFWGNSGSRLGDDPGRLTLGTLFHALPGYPLDGIDLGNSNLDPFDRRTWLANYTKAWCQPCQFCGARLNLACMLALLPQRSACDELCNLFISTVYPLMPILHLPSFIAEYRTFWSHERSQIWHTPESDQLVRRNPTFLCLLFSILFAATLINQSNMTDVFPDSQTRDAFSGKFYFAAMASLRLVGFPRRATNLALAAYLFTQLQLSREEEFSELPAFVSTSYRTALSMGLHRDGPNDFPPEQISTRRKLWCHVIHIDTMVASSSGLPPLFINEKISSTGMISVYQDMASTTQGNQTPHVDVRHLVASCRYTITQNLRHVIRNHLEGEITSMRNVEEMSTKLAGLRDSVWSIINTLHPGNSIGPALMESSLQFDDLESRDQELFAAEERWSISSSNPTVHTFRLYSSVLVHLMLHKTFIVLLHPFAKSTDRRIWTTVRRKAICHCHAFLRLFAQLCNDPSFACFSWLYPGTYQPLQPLSLLLADLYENPTSDEALHSLGLVDVMFSLYQTGEGITASKEPSSGPSLRHTFRGRNLSETGREAWSFLLNVRQSVLLKLRLDTHTLLPMHMGPWSPQQFCFCETPGLDPPLLDMMQSPTGGAPGPRNENPQYREQHDDMSSMHTSAGTKPFDYMTSQDMFNDVGGLDWTEWDAVLGDASGSLV